MRACLNRATLGPGSFDEFLDAASAAGFAEVEAGIEPLVELADAKGPRAAAEPLERRTLRLAAFFASPQWRNDDAEFEKTLAPFPRQIEVAAKLGVTRALVWVPSWADLPFADRWNQVVPRLRRMHDALAPAGIGLALEFLGPKTLRKSPHEFVHTLRQGLALADAVGPQAGLLLDVWHWYASGATLDELKGTPGEAILHVHLNDAPKLPIDELIDGERLLPGDGVIDLKGFLDVLRTLNYTGAVSVETFHKGLREMPMPQAAKLAHTAVTKALAR